MTHPTDGEVRKATHGDDIIAKLEAATEGSRELDADIARMLRLGEIEWDDGELTIGRFDESPIICPHWSTSLDAALKLMPEGWFLWRLAEVVTAADYVGKQHEHVGWIAEVQHRLGGRLKYAGIAELHSPVARGPRQPKTAALALCIAFLKARGIKP